MSRLVDLKSQCAGKWSAVLVSLGLPRESFSGRHTDCLVCGDTRRNARWNQKKEYWVCSKCGVTQSLDLALHWTGQSFKQTAAIIRGHRVDTMETIKTNDDTAKNKARLESIHRTLSVMNKHSPSAFYLRKRGVEVLPDKDCYYSPSVPYFQDGKKVGDFKAICSVFRNVAGETCSYHITYIEDGEKARVESPRKILPPIRPIAGAAIQLFAPVNGVLGIAEGVETSLAIHQLEGIPVWAAGNAQFMEAVEIPESVKEFHIYADSDPSFTGQKAAYTLAKKWALKGVKTRVHLLLNDNWLTDEGAKLDFLDRLLLEQHGKSQLGSVAL